MKHSLFLLFPIFFYSCVPQSTPTENAKTTINLWPSNSQILNTDERILDSIDDNILRITDIKQPSLTVFPAKGPGIKPAILIFPGGGYSILAYDLEGTEVAYWLNSIGFTAVIVKYTVPNNRLAALKDGQRAIHIVRKNSDEWDIDPNRIGVLGFSAGAHLSARLSTDFIVRKGNSLQNLNHEHTQPDFSILIYPAYLDDLYAQILESETEISSSISPTLMVQTKDDTNFVNGSIQYSNALTEASIDVTFHLFEKGGHGYGLRADPNMEVSKWPKLVEKWVFDKGIIDSPVNYK